MRVLYWQEQFWPHRGGVELRALDVLPALRERGHDITVVAAHTKLELPDLSDWNGFPIHRLRFHEALGGRNLKLTKALLAAVTELKQELQPDLVHFTYLIWGLSTRLPLVCRERGTPTIVTLTDFGLLCHRGQMYDWRLERCFGPHSAADCARYDSLRRTG